MKPVVLLLSLGLTSTFAHAADPVNSATPVNGFNDNSDLGCIDPGYAAQLVRKYGIETTSFPGGKELCDDGKSLVDHANVKLPAGAMVMDRVMGANIIPADHSPNPLYLDYYTMTLSKESEVEGLVGSTMRDFADKWTPAERENLVAIENDFAASGYQVRVFRDSVEATSGNNTAIAGVKPPEAGEFTGIGLALPCYVSGKIQTGIFLRMASNDIFRISFGGDAGPLKFAKQSCSFPADLRQVVKFKNQLLGLDAEGRLWTIGADGKRAAFFAAPNDARRFQSIVSTTRYRELIQ